MNHKDSIKNDLQTKGTGYFQKNYQIETKWNYLRRLRRSYFLESLREVTEKVRVLDIGCGPEILFPELLKSASEYVAVDLVKSNLEEIKKKYSEKKVNLVEGDMDNFEWSREYFDVIICSGVVEYTAEPYKNLLRMVSFLKKGGLLICSFPNNTSPYRIWSEYVYRFIWQFKNKVLKKEYHYYPRRLFNKNSVMRSLKRNLNPECVNVKYFGPKFIVQPLDYLFGVFDYSLTKFFESHPFWLTRIFCVEFIILLRK